MTKCPECDAAVEIKKDAVKGEIIVCKDCGAELEIRSASPMQLALAPKEEEDWGE